MTGKVRTVVPASWNVRELEDRCEDHGDCGDSSTQNSSRSRHCWQVATLGLVDILQVIGSVEVVVDGNVDHKDSVEIDEEMSK